MTALSAAAQRKRRSLHLSEVGRLAVATGITVYQGSLVSIVESSGRLCDGDNAAGETFVGVCEETATGNTGGTVYATFRFGHQELFAKASALTKAYTGCNVAISDDNTVTTLSDAGTAGVQVRVGELMEIEGSEAWVWIRHFSGKAAP